MLVTSRMHFTLPGLYARSLDEMKPREAAALLQAKAARLNSGAADTIAKLCGYLPLALDLAGSALAEQPDLEPVEYIARLRDAQSRVELIEASLGLSLGLIHARARSLWCKLGVFPGDFDMEAAVAVGGRDPDASREWVRELRKHSLIAWSEVTKRYRLHDLARLYAMSQLGPEEQMPPSDGMRSTLWD